MAVEAIVPGSARSSEGFFSLKRQCELVQQTEPLGERSGVAGRAAWHPHVLAAAFPIFLAANVIPRMEAGWTLLARWGRRRLMARLAVTPLRFSSPALAFRRLPLLFALAMLLPTLVAAIPLVIVVVAGMV